MATLKRFGGGQWGTPTRRRWGGSSWLALGGVAAPAPVASTAGYILKPFTETINAAVMASPPAMTYSATPLATNGTSPLGTGTTRIPGDDSRFTRIGVTGAVVVDSVWRMIGGGKAIAIEFWHTGTKLAYLFNLAANGGKDDWLFIDGRPATQYPVVRATDGTNQYGKVVAVSVDFGTSARRHVRIEFGSAAFAGIDIGPGDTIETTGTVRRKLHIHGDSWVAGASAGGATSSTLCHMAWLTGKALGADLYSNGIGGTGYGDGSGASNYAAASRLDTITTASPHDVLVFGSINDGTADVQVGATAFYSGVKTRVPDAQIVVVGRQSYSNATNTHGVDEDQQAAIAAATNVIGYISPRAETWVTGTGNTTAPAGDGNADMYHNGANINHLSLAGNYYYAEKLAAAIAALIPA